MKQINMLYLGAIGAILAVVGGLGAQTIAGGVTSSAANLSSVFVPDGDTGEMADELEDALPEIRDSIRKAMPYALLQFSGYLLFSLGFIGIWVLTKRGICVASGACFAVFAIVTLASLLILPQAMEELVDLLRGLSEDEELTTLPMSLLVLGATGLLSLVVQLGGCVAGGWEMYRIGKELDHDFLRGSGALLMVGAVAVFIPVYGALILLLAVAAVGTGFYLLATRVGETLIATGSRGSA